MDHLSPPPSPPTNSSAESKLLNYPKIMNGLDKLHVTMSPSSLIQRANLNTALKLNRGKYFPRHYPPQKKEVLWHERNLNEAFFSRHWSHRFIVAVQSVDLFEHIFLAIDIPAAVSECSCSGCGRYDGYSGVSGSDEYARLYANARKRRSARNRRRRTTELIDSTTIANTNHTAISGIYGGQCGRLFSPQFIAFACTDLVTAKHLWKGVEQLSTMSRRIASTRIGCRTWTFRITTGRSSSSSNVFVFIKNAGRIAGQFLSSGCGRSGRGCRRIFTSTPFTYGIVIIVIVVIIAIIQQVIRKINLIENRA